MFCRGVLYSFTLMPGISRRAVLKGLAATGASAVAGGGAYGFFYGRHGLQITRTAVPVAGLPSALNGLRIGFLTDVHRSVWVSAEDVGEAVALLMAAKPDVIVLGGDYVTRGDRFYVGPAADALAPLRAPHGVFGILGNHDDRSRGSRTGRAARARSASPHRGGESEDSAGALWTHARRAGRAATCRRRRGTEVSGGVRPRAPRPHDHVREPGIGHC